MTSKKNTASKKNTKNTKPTQAAKPTKAAAWPTPQELTAAERTLLNMATGRAHNRVFGDQDLRRFYPWVEGNVKDRKTLEFIAEAPNSELIPWLEKMSKAPAASPAPAIIEDAQPKAE
jgi:hypothetical protein